MARSHSSSTLLAVLSCLLIAACEATGPAAPSPSPPAPTADASEAPATPEELEAMRLRSDWGFPADLATVRSVAADPSAVTEPFGVPFLPAEIAEMQRRSVGSEAARAAVSHEAERAAGDYCGTYIDNQHGAAVTSMWRANLETHAINIALETGSLQYLAFVSCKYSQNELSALQERLSADDLRAWMAAIPATWTSIGNDTISNQLAIEISSAVPDAAERVHAHIVAVYGVPDDIIRVRSDGNGAALRPWGTVRIFVVRRDGTALGENSLGFDWKPQDMPNLYCGVGDVGFGAPWGSDPAELPCQAGTWRIAVSLFGEEYGAGTVTVRGGETVDLKIVLSREPPPFQG